MLIDDRMTVDNKESDTLVVDSTMFLNFSENEDLVVTRCREFLNSISGKTVENKTITEWYRYSNASLWWFVYRRVWARIEECIRFVENLKKIIEDVGPEIIVVEGFYDKVDLIRQICAPRNIKVIVPLRSLRRVLLQTTLKPRLWKVLVHRVNKKTRKKKIERISLAKELNRRASSVESMQDCVIYLAGGNYRKDIYDWREGKMISGEHIVQMVLERVIKEKKLLCIDVDNFYSSDSMGFLKKRLKDTKEYWIPFEMFITNELEKECKSSIQTLTKSIIALYKKREFQNAFVYQHVRFWPALELLFKALLAEIYLPNYILSIEAARHLLSKARARSIFLPYETGIYAMAFIVAAEDLGIKSFGIQHGIIHTGHFDYSIDNLRTTESGMGCPIPTFLLVFGEFYRKVLVETFSYPEDRVIIVGNPAYESSSMYDMDSRKAETLCHFGLDPSKKTVLVATSMHQAKYGRADYDVLLVQSLAEAFSKSDSDIQVLVKTHPTEDPGAYSKIIREKSASNFIIIEEYPIQQLIAVCDVFVSVLSTTIFEAMVMNKPVIIAQASEKIHRDVMSIAESGAAIRSSFSELSKTILDLLSDTSLRKELSLKSLEVIKDHFNFPTSDINAKIAELLISK